MSEEEALLEGRPVATSPERALAQLVQRLRELESILHNSRNMTREEAEARLGESVPRIPDRFGSATYTEISAVATLQLTEAVYLARAEGMSRTRLLEWFIRGSLGRREIEEVLDATDPVGTRDPDFSLFAEIGPVEKQISDLIAAGNEPAALRLAKSARSFFRQWAALRVPAEMPPSPLDDRPVLRPLMEARREAYRRGRKILMQQIRQL